MSADSRNKMLLQVINEAFVNVPFPKAEELAASGGDEASAEANAFRGKLWHELSAGFLHRNRDALFWFTPEAFHYYLPAYLTACVETEDINALYVHNVLSFLRPPENETLAHFRRERLSMLSHKQLDVLEKWLEWLRTRAVTGGVFEEELEDARKAVRQRSWETW